ncbi:hypothetical protein GGR96_001939 [Thalassospira tepidiphila]|uniref:Uncharacterized protein n=1 Tax=Thalassospira tepidiphila TaxID=393657 RepID=A0ABX0X049_9PROT|nr:hypothetical protein [Thalassospira tepidiphila]
MDWYLLGVSGGARDGILIVCAMLFGPNHSVFNKEIATWKRSNELSFCQAAGLLLA